MSKNPFQLIGEYLSGFIVFLIFLSSQGCLRVTFCNPSDAKSVANAKAELDRAHKANILEYGSKK